MDRRATIEQRALGRGRPRTPGEVRAERERQKQVGFYGDDENDDTNAAPSEDFDEYPNARAATGGVPVSRQRGPVPRPVVSEGSTDDDSGKYLSPVRSKWRQPPPADMTRPKSARRIAEARDRDGSARAARNGPRVAATPRRGAAAGAETRTFREGPARKVGPRRSDADGREEGPLRRASRRRRVVSGSRPFGEDRGPAAVSAE